MDAALSGLRGSERAVLDRIAASRAGSQTPQREAAITMLAATIVRGAQEAAMQELFASIADDGHAGSGSDRRCCAARKSRCSAPRCRRRRRRRARRAGNPRIRCRVPTCPGGRAGPGGAYAFPRPEGWPTTGGGRGAGPGLRLNREPAALLGARATQDDLRHARPTLLARVALAGKGRRRRPSPR